MVFLRLFDPIRSILDQVAVSLGLLQVDWRSDGTAALASMSRGAEPLAAAPAGDVAAARELCLRKILEREGITMLLALHDTRTGQAPTVTDGPARREGARLAELFDHYRDGLAPLPRAPGAAGSEEPDPTGAGALIDVLVVLADQRRHAGARPVR